MLLTFGSNVRVAVSAHFQFRTSAIALESKFFLSVHVQEENLFT